MWLRRLRLMLFLIKPMPFVVMYVLYLERATSKLMSFAGLNNSSTACPLYELHLAHYYDLIRAKLRCCLL